MVGWLQPDGIHIDLAFRYTLEHLRAPKTPRNIPLKMPPYIPKDESGIKGHQQTLSDNPEECLRVVLECLKMRNLARLEPTHHFGTTLKWGIFFTWRLQDIKISKPPYVPVPKMVQLCHFL